MIPAGQGLAAARWRGDLDRMRSPLTTIAGLAELLDEHGAPAGPEREWIGAIHAAAEELLEQLEAIERRGGLSRA